MELILPLIVGLLGMLAIPAWFRLFLCEIFQLPLTTKFLCE